MAITLDTHASSITTGFSAGPNTKTWSHTVSGSQTLLVVCAAIWQDVGGTGTITSLSYGGLALTKVDQRVSTAMSGEMWYLASPPNGNAIVSVTVTGAIDAIKFDSISFNGVAASPLDTTNFATGASGDPSGSITTGVANAVVVSVLHRFTTTNATPNTSTNILNEKAASTLISTDYLLVASPGATTIGYTGASANDWVIIMGSFKPFVQAAQPTSWLSA